MTIQSPPRMEAPYVLSESGIMLPAGMVDRDAVGGGGGGGWSIIGTDIHEEWGAGAHDFTIPTDTAANDLILVFTGGRSGVDFTKPGTYAQIFYYDEGGNCRTQCYYRYAGAAEGDTTEQWSKNTDRENVQAMVVVRGGATAGDPQDVVRTKRSDYSITMHCPAITTSTDGCLLLHWYGKRWNSNAITEDAGYPSGKIGLLHRTSSMGVSLAGLCYKVAGAADVQAEVDWPDLPAGETNLGIQVTLALKAG